VLLPWPSLEPWRLTACWPPPTLHSPKMVKGKTHKSLPRSLPNGNADATSQPFLRFLERHRRRFESHLDRKLHTAQRRFPRIGTPSVETLQSLVDLCQRGGKRVRPGLVLGGALCISDAPPRKVLFDAAVALELLHGYFLVHDDWMDGDLTRRGGPSVHAALRQRFGNDHLGDAAAILAGDWGVAVATDWMTNLALPSARLRAALRCFADMQLAAVVGQIRDLVADDDDAELTYRLKTASYTVCGPLLLGAILAGANAAQQKDILGFALPIGEAFQLRDDLIGVFAPSEQTGKPFASDVRAGKRTVLVRECLQRVSARQASFMQRILHSPAPSEKDLLRFVALLDSSGAKARVEARIATLCRRGLAKLGKARLRAAGKTLLASAAAALTVRHA
jgi:geranylgeranyl diphosphate synthase, type I